ncbi:hypothetical protein KUH03_39090 [Sphingobacterium sp. E70]|uniref:hypothetical protein n=1 Tax=Sphingobacterium sp. E70 TaxID=2853439 RepID=UPI00211C89A5|nr:hypothetical protein [Sphingobacterium sp. E70]ULT24836.1 hypothetical protein KUH03_39090 [Sphingobacterium sp. E70]
MENYSNIIKLNSSNRSVFNALSNDIPRWWTEMFEGVSDQEGKSFTIHFGNMYSNNLKYMNLLLTQKWYGT